MKSLTGVWLWLSYVSLTESRPPCEKVTLVFTSTAAPSKTYRHEIRLGNTYTLVRVGDPCVAYWYGNGYVESLKLECDFLANQVNLLNEILEFPVMRKLEIKLVYSADLWDRTYVFKLYVQGLPLTTFDGQRVRRLRYPSERLQKEVIEAADRFVFGRHGSILVQYAKEFETKWTAACETIRKRPPSFDAYRMWYHPDTDRVFCAVWTALPWTRDIVIGRHRAKPDWSYGDARYLIVGSAPREDDLEITCAILSSSGLLARQQLVIRPDEIRSRASPRPQTTGRTEETEGRSVSARHDTRTPVPSDPGLELVTEMNWITAAPELEAEMPRTTSDSSATVAAIVVVLVLVSGSAVGLFACRERIRRTGPGFLRLCRR